MNFTSIFRNKILAPLILSILSILIAFILNTYFSEEQKIQKLISNFQNEIYQQEEKLNNALEKISLELKNDANYEILNSNRANGFCENNGMLFLIYENDSLKYWTDNSVPVPDIYSEKLFDVEFNHLENSYSLIKQLEKGNRHIIGLNLIKNDYKYQNEYLKNNFKDIFKLGSNIEIQRSEGKYNIYSSSGEFLFSLQKVTAAKISDKKIFILFLLYLLGFLFFISFLYQAHKSATKDFKKNWIFLVTFIIDLIIVRIIIVYFKIPDVLFESDLFSPVYYAASKFLPSLGHLLIDTIILLTISFVFSTKLILNKGVQKNNVAAKNFTVIALLLLVFILFKGLIFMFRGIIINSSISLDLNHILDLSSFSVFSYFIIVSLVLSFFLLATKLLDIVYFISSSLKKLRLTLLFSVILICILQYLSGKDQLINTFVLAAFVISYGIFLNRKKELISFTTVVFYLFLFAFFSTNILHKNLNIKEIENRKLLAIKLSAERDPVAEYLFKDIEVGIYDDELLSNYIIDAAFDEQSEIQAIEYLQKNYFNDYWSKYDLQITICSKEELLDIEFDNIIINCNEYFEKKITDMGIPTNNPNLFYMDYGYGDHSYIGILEFKRSSETSDTVVNAYIETVSKIVPKGLGYPELLIDREINVKNESSLYSYAIYKKNELIKLVGKFYYSINDKNYERIGSEFTFFDKDNYNHLFYKPDQETSIIISKPNSSFLDIIAPFSYLFISFGIYVLLFLIIINFPFRNKKIELNFRNQLQFSIVSIILVSFLLIGITSLTFIKSLNNNKNYDILSEKAHSVLIELEHKLSGEDDLSPELHDYLAVLLVKFSNVFFSDINLYDLNGKLLASSRPQIFEEGLISDKMNAYAYQAMANKNMSRFIQKEKICKYEYLSAYVPFRNDQNKLIAYLNLPYFAKQDELRKEISTFLVAFINIYVILIAISIFIALLVSNYISRPLKLIKDKISHLQFGKSNEKINWERKDEIGNLITEYNRMIDELAKSASLLAKSERESAWREMAKQVAHEIKNPLTPMKLNVQHLRKAWKEKASDWDDRLNKFSNTLIEQIDSLSTIASEFSDFANMPKAKAEKIELSEIIKNSIELHKNYENIQLEYLTHSSEPFYVLADKKQIFRVFNNLIKNSIQAIGHNNKGWIKIMVESLHEEYKISVSDNGSGISKDQGDKIFIPSFTTKSSGMGLGLSMVKSIVLSAGGNITYSSQESQGTTFFISLPKYKENK